MTIHFLNFEVKNQSVEAGKKLLCQLEKTLSLEVISAPLMEKMLNKFSNPHWLYKVIFLAMGGLLLHIQFLSALMGR